MNKWYCDCVYSDFVRPTYALIYNQVTVTASTINNKTNEASGGKMSLSFPYPSNGGSETCTVVMPRAVKMVQHFTSKTLDVLPLAHASEYIYGIIFRVQITECYKSSCHLRWSGKCQVPRQWLRTELVLTEYKVTSRTFPTCSCPVEDLQSLMSLLINSLGVFSFPRAMRTTAKTEVWLFFFFNDGRTPQLSACSS